MSILETIDNAVQDWETSGDAMRWTPEPPRVADFAERSGFGLTEWQRQALASLFAVPDAEAIDAQITAAFEPLRRQFAESIKGVRLSFALLDEPFRRLPLVRNRMRTCQPLRPARISAMRRAYRHKTRNRW